jgi:hypothetical protein
MTATGICVTEHGTIIVTENEIKETKEAVEWRLEPYKGWAIEYPIVTNAEGAKFTPLSLEWWRENAPTC